VAHRLARHLSRVCAAAQAKANRENIFAVFCGLLPTVAPRQVRSGTSSDFRPFSIRGF
jgi:hypothetical protein